MNRYTSTFKDIVCGMEVSSDDISLEYQGSYYVFCSKQCLERFQLNPHLYIGYPGVESPKHAGMEVLKKRTLKLAEPLPQDVSDQFIKYIKGMMGIHSIEIKGNCITIIYDLLQATELQVEKKIIDVGVELDDDLMEKVRRAYVHIIEGAEVDSLEARPGSKSGHHH